MSVEHILSGPKSTWDVFEGSVAEYLIPKMKSYSKDFISQIDSSTGETISGRDFLEQCVQVAEGLIKFGLKKGDVVLLACPNSINCHVAAVGVMFSTGILAPIDYNLKPYEMQHLIRTFQPKYIICENNKTEIIMNNVKQVGIKAKIIVLDLQESTTDFFTFNDIKTDVDVDNYTPRKIDHYKDTLLISCSSGSSGYPKGVACSHYGFLYNIFSLQKSDNFNLGKCIMIVSPLFWISGTMLTLISCAFQLTRAIPKSSKPEDLLHCIEKYQPQFTMLSPSSVVFLIEHPNFKTTNVKSMKLVFTGGSVLRQEIIEKVKSAWKDVCFLQGYGMTELAGGITTLSYDGDIRSVGRLLPDTQMKVVNLETGLSLGPNEVGECRIKAERIMNGYYNNIEATKETFDEEGWFKTGDLVYYTEDESIYVVGRIKETIKCQDCHVSLAELENFIVGLPGIKDAAIVPIPNDRDYSLKAVVVKNTNSNITADYIIESVKENFSEYKHLKGGVDFIDALPRSEVGKLRRWELKKMYETC